MMESFSMQLLYYLLFFSLLYVALSVNGLKWVRVNVPQFRVPGETAILHCDYDLGGDALYAVKWYKEHEEFYRFVPKATPQANSYKVEGVHVDMSKSDSKKVTLHSVGWKTSGLFRCEVSAEAPSFASAQSEARMEVVYIDVSGRFSLARSPQDGVVPHGLPMTPCLDLVTALPQEDPVITGVETQYQIGDEINLNCTSGRSYPASILHWYINEQQVVTPSSLIRYPHTHHKHGLMSVTLGLKFTLSSRHFLGGSMRVKCVASVSPELWRGDRESVVQSMAVKDMREALLLVKSSTSSIATPSSTALVVCLISLWNMCVI